MMLYFSILLAMFSVSSPPSNYQAVVVNATTSRPIAGVNIVDLKTQTSSTTDAQGHFGLAGPIAHFRLHSLGFADVEATRSALQPGQLDTLRLLPNAILLSEVSVRPTKTVVLSSVGTKAGKSHGTILVLGAQYGILFQPAASMRPAVVQEISVRFRPGHSTIGRIRVRLVAPERHSLMTPSAHDLVPIAATYTAAELAALPNHLLTIDLSAYNIQLPATGFFVLIEGLATVAGETYVTDKLVGSKGKLDHVIVTASDPKNPATFRETPTSNYPVVSWTPSVTEVETVTRLGGNRSWTIKHQERNAKKTDNADISLSILAE